LPTAALAADGTDNMVRGLGAERFRKQEHCFLLEQEDRQQEDDDSSSCAMVVVVV
jgi:hypothetical protein